MFRETLKTSLEGFGRLGFPQTPFVGSFFLHEDRFFCGFEGPLRGGVLHVYRGSPQTSPKGPRDCYGGLPSQIRRGIPTIATLHPTIQGLFGRSQKQRAQCLFRGLGS